MKIKLIALLLLGCFVLSSCHSENAPLDVTPTQAKDSSGLSLDTKETATKAPDSTQPSPTNETYIPPDYSSHTNADEEDYKTILAYLPRLKDGERIFAMTELAADWSGRKFEGFTRKDDTWGFDVRSCDISNENLDTVNNFNKLSFNTDTVWPDKLPEGFDPQQILEFNKNPGLGIRALHEQGITGTGVGIAIIDQPLLLEHEQYKDNLMYYERIHSIGDEADMHGPAVSSIAVGKDIGTAPGSKLYYIAETHGHVGENGFEYDFFVTVDSILRVLEINKNLPQNEKIRVISISSGYGKNDPGYQKLNAAISKAEKENVFVITTSTNEYFDFPLFGMYRDYGKDPDDPNSYKPVGWIEDDLYAVPDSDWYKNLLLVPMGSRTYAGCTGTDDYEIKNDGGMSWVVPWLAGFYAMCCQVKPDITPQEFISVTNDTAVPTNTIHDGKTYCFGKIINPAAVIEHLQSK